MRLLVVIPSYPKLSGVDYHRLWMPHQEFNFEGVSVSAINEVDSKDDDFLKDFDLVVANRFISKTGDTTGVIKKLKRVGIPFVLDLDDDYRLPHDHILSTAHRTQNHARQIIDGIEAAAGVTCTHEMLATNIGLETNQKNVFIVPNGINPTGQFELKEFKSDQVVFGWSGSITHFDDVMLVHDGLYSLYKTSHKFKMVYGGYESGQDLSNAIAGVLSCKGKAPKGMFELFPSQDAFHYGEFYDKINTMLIPLRENRFNNMKSNLKLLEAGFKAKAVICSDVYPYSTLLTSKNSIKVKSKHDWYRAMVRIIENPILRVDLAEQLYYDVQDYHISKVAKLRFEAYKNILK